MHFLISFLALVSVISINADISPLVKYRDAIEKINIDLLLKNDHVVSFFVKCFVDKKYCNKDGMLVRSAIPEILSTNCANCTEKEKEVIRKCMNFIYTTRKDDFEKMYDQFDPHRIHRTSVMNFMNNSGAPAKHNSIPSSHVVH